MKPESFGEKWVAPPDGPPDEAGSWHQETAVPRNRSAISEGAPPTALHMPSHAANTDMDHICEDIRQGFVSLYSVKDPGVVIEAPILVDD